MSQIRAKNTTPELRLRRALHALGLRYRTHVKDLPGSPDLVLPRWNAVIFVHGCFWHGHECPAFRWPKTREDFWRAKITGNRLRDEKNLGDLLSMGWRVLTVWECAIPSGEKVHSLATSIKEWLVSSGSNRWIVE